MQWNWLRPGSRFERDLLRTRGDPWLDDTGFFEREIAHVLRLTRWKAALKRWTQPFRIRIVVKIDKEK